jgi:hypothetical protein
VIEPGIGTLYLQLNIEFEPGERAPHTVIAGYPRVTHIKGRAGATGRARPPRGRARILPGRRDVLNVQQP